MKIGALILALAAGAAVWWIVSGSPAPGGNSDPMARYQEGSQALEAGDKLGAIDAFYDALSMARTQGSDALDEVEPQLRAGLVRSLLGSGDRELAQQELDQLALLAGETLDVRFLRGEMLRVQREYAKAFPEYRAVVDGQPDHAPALVGLGFCQIENHALLAAKKTFQRAIALDAHLAEAHAGLGIVKFQDQKDAKGSRVLLERALAMDNDIAEAHQFLGHIELMEGARDKGIWHLREVMRLDPDRLEVARALRRMGVALTHEAAVGEAGAPKTSTNTP